MKKLLILSSAVVIMLSGCATDLTSAITALSDAAVTGALTYEQIMAVKAAAKAEQGSYAPPAEEGATGPTTPVVPQKPAAPVSGMASAVVLGSTRCGYTTQFLAMQTEAAVETAFPHIDFVHVDEYENAAAFAKYRPRNGFLYPLVRCFDADGNFVGEFLSRGVPLSKVVSQIGDLLPKK